MARIEREARVIWEGDQLEGRGTLEVGSGALGVREVRWRDRVVVPERETGPEELLAAAQAESFAMTLAQVLARRLERPAKRLTVQATCRMDWVPAGPTITRMQVLVRGVVPGISAEEFERAARDAAQMCPVMRAFQGNLELWVSAELDSRA
jgi:osmotically inducible protein OsmC